MSSLALCQFLKSVLPFYANELLSNIRLQFWVNEDKKYTAIIALVFNLTDLA